MVRGLGVRGLRLEGERVEVNTINSNIKAGTSVLFLTVITPNCHV